MYISKQKGFQGMGRASIALLIVISACFSAKIFAQVPVQIQASNTGLHPSDLSITSELTPNADYESTDFTFDLADLAMMTAEHHSSGTISCQRVTDLDFGRAYSGVSAGTVVMDPNSNTSRNYTGGVILDDRNHGHPAHIQLTIYNSDHCDTHDHCNNDNDECGRSEDDDSKTNDTRTGFTRHGVWNTITLPSSSTLTLTLGGKTYTMTADTYKFIRTNGDFYIGATLHVGANQVAGVYTGTFTVTQTCD